MDIEKIEQLKPNKEVKLYCTDAVIKIKEGTQLHFKDKGKSALDGLNIRKDIELFNFNEFLYGDCLATCYDNQANLSIINNDSIDITTQMLEFNDGQIKIRQAFMGCMFTSDVQIALDDCLGYVIKPLSIETHIE